MRTPEDKERPYINNQNFIGKVDETPSTVDQAEALLDRAVIDQTNSPLFSCSGEGCNQVTIFYWDGRELKKLPEQ